MDPELSDAASVRPFHHDGSTLVAETTGTGATTYVLVHGIGMGRSVFVDAVRVHA